MPSKKPKLDTFRKVANACGGILSDIAANLGVERSTIYTWCNDDEQFAQALEDSRERFVDLAESNGIGSYPLGHTSGAGIGFSNALIALVR